MKSFFSTVLAVMFLTACASKKPQTTQEKPKSNGASRFDAELTSYPYPFEVRYFPLKTQQQELKMAYMDIAAGKPTGKVIVLFHGKNFSGAYFESLILGLNQSGYRVIIPDQIGFGKSSKPAYYQYSFHTLAENTRLLLDSLGVNKFYLLGHSMGGMLATRFTLMFPEKVQKLFLINPIGLEDWKTLISYRPVEENFKSEMAQTPESLKKYQLENYYDGRWKPEYDRWLEIPVGWLHSGDRELIAWNSALTADMIFTQPVYYEFKFLKTPTVLLIGDRDRTAIGKAWAAPNVKNQLGQYPKISKDVSRMIPKSKLIFLKGKGHMPFIEDFESFWRVFAREI